MATETASSVIRAALRTDINLTADQLIEKVNASGIKASPQTVKNLSYNLRAKLKKNPAKPASPVKAPTRNTPKPKRVRATPTEAPISTPESSAVATPTASAPDVSSVLKNVALVNKVVGQAGGMEGVKQVVEAVRACGGVEAFLQHLELVAGIRGGDSV